MQDMLYCRFEHVRTYIAANQQGIVGRTSLDYANWSVSVETTMQSKSYICAATAIQMHFIEIHRNIRSLSLENWIWLGVIFWCFARHANCKTVFASHLTVYHFLKMETVLTAVYLILEFTFRYLNRVFKLSLVNSGCCMNPIHAPL